MGVPQYRSREIAQSTLFRSHSPKRPSWKCPGYHVLYRFMATTSSLCAVLRMYHEGLA